MSEEITIIGKVGLKTINVMVPQSHTSLHDVIIDKMFEPTDNALKPFVDRLTTTPVFSEKLVLCGFVTTLGECIVRMCIAFDPKIEGSIVIIWFDNGNFKLYAIEGDEAEILSSDKIIYPDPILDWVNNIEIK